MVYFRHNYYEYEFNGKKFNICFTNPVKIKNNKVYIIIDKLKQRIINGKEFINWYFDLLIKKDVVSVKVTEELYNCITDDSTHWTMGVFTVRINGIADAVKKDYVDIANKIAKNDSRKNVDERSKELVERIFDKIINAIDVITQ